jgi:hypothetical protein
MEGRKLNASSRNQIIVSVGVCHTLPMQFLLRIQVSRPMIDLLH